MSLKLMSLSFCFLQRW